MKRWIWIVLAALMLITACGQVPGANNKSPGNRNGNGQGTAQNTPSATPEPVLVLTANPADGAKDVPVDTVVKVDADKGKIDTVSVTGQGKDGDGKDVTTKVDGTVAQDGSWQAFSRLDPMTTYTVEASGTGADGRPKSAKSVFTTAKLSLKQQVFPSVYPEKGQTVGVAMPIIMRFDMAVTDKAAFERNMKVTTVPEQEGSWGWIDDNEAHWRPKEYWQPGTKVHMEANLNGVSAGNGMFGQESRSTDFTIGKNQQLDVDLRNHELTQKVDGKVVKTIPISAGKPGFATRSGIKVVTEKLASTRMNSETTGISQNSSEGYNLQVKYALRITDSGEFLHAAPWNGGYFGYSNQSHGCTGMSTSNAASLFSSVQVGDPAVYTGSSRKMELGNGVAEWNLNWEQWQAKSALPR